MVEEHYWQQLRVQAERAARIGQLRAEVDVMSESKLLNPVPDWFRYSYLAGAGLIVGDIFVGVGVQHGSGHAWAYYAVLALALALTVPLNVRYWKARQMLKHFRRLQAEMNAIQAEIDAERG